ncbi:MAG: IclR family transcriptional regulator, partial [Chloroflexota bacterium]|nr:IclR family transcriptional regulator [Chloroflexota bacterium]
ILRGLTEQTRETSNLVVLDDAMAVYIETVPSPHVVRMFTTIGNRVPLHSTGVGKALLAALSTDRRDALIDRIEMRAYTPRTIVEKTSLRRALEEVRERGYAIDDEEFDEGVRCVAIAVGPVGDPIGAISVSAPAGRMTRQRCGELAPLVRRAATELGEAMRDQARL